ncbi:MAG: DUF494 family protein [Proteobacteria bacterium]|nr:DUF494 family protein [Pseudomonadota bacterium]
MQKKEALLLLQMLQEATQWLMSLTEPALSGLKKPEQKSLRIFTEDECESLSYAGRKLILNLEQQGIVSPELRERIIHHAMQLQMKNIDQEIIECITRIILTRQPEGAEALSRMELLIAKTDNLTVH